MLRGIRLIVAAGLLLGAPAAWSSTGPHYEEGLRLLKQFDFEAAQRSFEEALEWPGNTRADRATIFVHIGIAQSNQNDYKAAEASFKKALAEDRTVELPRRTSPKIRALFEKVRAEARPVAEPAPAPEPVRAPQPQLPRDAQPGDDSDQEPRPYSAKWPAWVTLGVAVAAGGAGLAMGMLNLTEKSRAEDRTLPFKEAQEHADTASSRGLAANVLFGVAGAAAVASGVLFYFGYRKHQRASAAVMPTGSGLMVHLELRR